jgi:hypothetical protein
MVGHHLSITFSCPPEVGQGASLRPTSVVLVGRLGIVTKFLMIASRPPLRA